MKRSDIHYSIYILGVIVLMASIPLSHFLMGLVCFILFLNWVAEWNWREKWERARHNWQGFLLAGVFCIGLLGLIRTDDWANAGSLLLSQLPILFSPIIIISSKNFSKRAIDWIFNAFILATFFGCICSIIYWLTHTVNDIREISIFIDHIRFSLCIVLSMVLCLQAAVRRVDISKVWRIGYTVLVLLMFVYLFVAQTLTGIITALVIVVLYIVYLLCKMPNNRMKWSLFTVMLLVLLAVASYAGYITYQYYYDQDTMIMAKRTEQGNPYEFNVESIVENGHRIDYYVCKSELVDAWSQRSDKEYDGMLEQTLIRYLNSKGLRKDFGAVMSLSEKEIHNVESGIANFEYTKSFGLKKALYPTFFCFSLYKNCGYIDNSSLLQRVELWRTSCDILRDNWLFGVGLGDYKADLDAMLEANGSTIAYKHNRGCHNQFLTYWLIGGVLAVGYFIFILLYPFFKMKQKVDFVYVSFFLIMVLSMFVEDTIASQTGRMLFVVINPLLLFSLPMKDVEKTGVSNL